MCCGIVNSLLLNFLLFTKTIYYHIWCLFVSVHVYRFNNLLCTDVLQYRMFIFSQWRGAVSYTHLRPKISRLWGKESVEKI